MAVGDYRPGDLLGGRYRVQATLGRGSTGVTYRVSEKSPPQLRAGLRLLGHVPLYCAESPVAP